MLKLQRAAEERAAAECDAVVPPAGAQDRQDAQAVSARTKKSKKLRQTPWTNLQPRPLAQGQHSDALFALKVVFIEAMLLYCCCGCHFC